jgi:hypothetical protein
MSEYEHVHDQFGVDDETAEIRKLNAEIVSANYPWLATRAAAPVPLF